MFFYFLQIQRFQVNKILITILYKPVKVGSKTVKLGLRFNKIH